MTPPDAVARLREYVATFPENDLVATRVSDLRTLLALLADAERDRARMDWLEACQWSAYRHTDDVRGLDYDNPECACGHVHDDLCNVDGCPCPSHESTDEPYTASGPTLRAALDTAMQPAPAPTTSET